MRTDQAVMAGPKGRWKRLAVPASSTASAPLLLGFASVEVDGRRCLPH